MAILKKTKKVEEVKAVAPAVVAPKASTKQDVADCILSPRVTEKASMKVEGGVYTFEVTKDATKKSIAKAVQKLYKVIPVKVNIVKIPEKQVFVRGKFGTKSGGKKAYVYLKEGDKIEFV
jgi:large subunit ribosomal protein L23